jgi:DUF3006 family protein
MAGSSHSSHSSQAGPTSTWVVDQIENGIASVEINERTMITIPLAVLPRGVTEGDVLRVTITPDPAEQARRLQKSAAQVAKGKNGGKGNITL